jgi:hypothetical protein
MQKSLRSLVAFSGQRRYSRPTDAYQREFRCYKKTVGQYQRQHSSQFE